MRCIHRNEIDTTVEGGYHADPKQAIMRIIVVVIIVHELFKGTVIGEPQVVGKGHRQDDGIVKMIVQDLGRTSYC